MLAFYEYNELGQLLNKRVGGANSASPTGLQKIDFTYNIRGWLTEINNINQLNQAGAPKDLFAYKLNYNTVQNENGYTGKAQFNGNISEIYWRSDSDNQLRKYGYQYDDLNRLKQAIFQMPGATIAVPETYNESLKYDKNGNITELIRRGRDISDSQTITIDHLVYNYQNHSNKVIKISDLTNNSLGFHDGTNQAVEYFYDILGNLTRDLNKEIGTTSQNGIRYNHLNLPNQITKGSNNASYCYNATGQKMKKVVVHNGVNTTTDYLDGFQYKNGVLEFFGHAEGYVASNKYFYQYKDQLGNIRMTFTANASGIATIVEENHYYPYGLKHSGYGTNATIANDAHKYRYNSREWQNELDLNYTAMDFRLYDNAVGRFWCMDALSEKYHYISPYHFGNNNPVFWSDPSGLSATSSEFTHDFMGRARFDKYGMFIPPFERQYKSITTDGGNGEGSGGGGSQLMSLLKALSNIAGTDVTWTNKNGSWHSDTGLILRPSGNGWILWEPFSSVEELTDSGSELGGVICGMRKIFVFSGDNENSYQMKFDNHLRHQFFNNFTFEDAVWHYRLGGGKSVDVSINQINLKGITLKSFEGAKKTEQGNPYITINLFKGFHDKTGLIYGKLDLVLLNPEKGTVWIKPNDYDFNIEYSNGFSSRNIYTFLGSIYNGPGIPYTINFIGFQYVPKN